MCARDFEASIYFCFLKTKKKEKKKSSVNGFIYFNTRKKISSYNAAVKTNEIYVYDRINMKRIG